MAINALEKKVVRRLKKAVQAYARHRGWSDDDYQLYLRLNLDWLSVHMIIVGKDFPGRGPHGRSQLVREFLKNELADEPNIRDALGLSLLTFEELEDEAPLGSEFVDVQDL